MSEFKGTKGKLKLHESTTLNQSGFHMQSISSEFNNKMLFANTYGETKEEGEANAKLIACAPEMLEMLDNVYSYFEDNQEKVGTPDIMFQIENLIKKATE